MSVQEFVESLEEAAKKWSHPRITMWAVIDKKLSPGTRVGPKSVFGLHLHFDEDMAREEAEDTDGTPLKVTLKVTSTSAATYKDRNKRTRDSHYTLWSYTKEPGDDHVNEYYSDWKDADERTPRGGNLVMVAAIPHGAVAI